MSHRTHVKLLINLSEEKALTSKSLIKNWSRFKTCIILALIMACVILMPLVSALALHPLQVVSFMVIYRGAPIDRTTILIGQYLSNPVINDKFRAVF